MEFARSKDQPWVDLVSGMYREGVMDLPFSFILAQRASRNVLVDTGFMQDDKAADSARKFGIPTWISPLRMLAEMDLKADDITDIFITHAHFDHMGSIAEFPEAHIHIQKSELLSWYELSRCRALRPSHRDHRSRQSAHGARRLDRASRDPGRRRQGQRSAGNSRSARQRPHHRPAVRRDRDGGGPTGHVRRLRLFAPPDSPGMTTTASMFRSTTLSAASGSSSRPSTR